MTKIENIKCSEVTQNDMHFAIYHTSEFLPFMQKLSVPHRHNYYMLLFNERNNGLQLIDFKESAITPHSITCMHLGQVHKWIDYHQLDGYLLFFENEFFALQYQDYQLSEFTFLTYRFQQPYLEVGHEQFDAWKKIILWMMQEYKEKKMDYVRTLQLLLHVLLIDLKRAFIPLGANREISQSIQLIYHFEQLVDKHYKQKHFVKDYAELLYVRPNYLNAVCGPVTGVTAGEVIRTRVLLEAKRLLIHEHKSVAEIAFELGFEDNSYFGKFFKKHELITPEGFKKKYFYQSKSVEVKS